MKPVAQILVGAGAVLALMALNAVVEFLGTHPTAWVLTMSTVALAGVARLVFVTARPR